MMKDKASLWAGARRFEDILRKDPRAYSFAPLSDIYRELGLIEDALSVARKGCGLHPDFAAGQMAFARAAFESSLKDEARRALEAVIRITPENIEAQRILADIYSAEGDESAALRCLAVASSLDTQQSLPVLPEESSDEDILDADILELTDDLIEEEGIEEPVTSPFSADPERPSLGDVVRAEPYLMETAPPLYEEPSPATPPASVASATIAELFVSQGFPEKGAEVYRELLQADPDNQVFIRRIDELLRPVTVSIEVEEPLKASAAVAKESPGSQSIMDTLNDWLVNIRGVRECRTKIL
jgi:tetratricopeptide (TPR) repeat protein